MQVTQQILLIEKVVLAHAGLLFCLGILIAIVNMPYFDQVYSVEDGVLEWLTFLALLQTAAISLWRLRLSLRNVHAVKKSFLVGVFVCSLLFVFGAGEEISWGQRLVNLSSGEFFQKNNVQGETNFHNLMIGGHKINKLIFGKGVALFFILYLLVLTPLYWQTRQNTAQQGWQMKVCGWIDSWAVPIPKGYQWWSFLLVVVGVEGVVQGLSETGRRGELTEFAAAMVVMLVVVFPYNQGVFELNKK